MKQGRESGSKGCYRACSYCGQLTLNPTGTSGRWHGTHSSDLTEGQRAGVLINLLPLRYGYRVIFWGY